MNVLLKIMLLCFFVLQWLGCTSNEVKEGYVIVDEGALYYQEAGKGKAVVFIHDHPLDHRMWEAQFYRFSKKYRAIRYDMRGYGRSSKQREGYQFTHAADLVQLMNALSINKAHFIGLSMGGFVGADMLGCYPERVRSAVLVSGNICKIPGPSNPMDEEEAAYRDEEIAQIKAQGVETVKRELFDELMSTCGSHSERVSQSTWEMICDWNAWQPLHKEARTVLGMDAYVALQEYQPETPVLLVEGNAPGNQYSEMPDILIYLPNGSQVVLDDCGHLLNMEQPELFNKTVLDFLASIE